MRSSPGSRCRWLNPRPGLPAAHRPAGRLGLIDVLFLCTGNICRSPMAEALLRDRLERAGVAAHVHSAGLTFDDRPATDHTLAVLEARGIDLRRHRSRIMRRELLAQADLVIGMTREHVREAVLLEPSCWTKAFTLKELVRRGEGLGGPAADESLDVWLADVGAGRNRQDLMGWDPDDDVADPYGLDRATYERTAAELEALVDRLVPLLAPGAQRRSA